MNDLLDRTGPVLLFLVAITVLAELADLAGVFDVAAHRAARVARGRTLALFGLVVVLATATTVLLSLDTTAVLMTPVVLALAQQLELDPMPFAFTTVWLANTASLLLPVSNLTNLLAVDRLGLTTGGYVAELALPALVAVAITAAALLLWHRSSLTGRFEVPAPSEPQDRVLFLVTGAACALLVPLLLAGVEVALAAGASALVAVIAFAARDRAALRLSLVPWRLVLSVSVLFAVVRVVGPLGVDDLLRQGVGGPLRTAFVAAAGSNVVNNLPAYLAVERVVPHTHLTAVLLGTNLGPLVTPWASLATLLWADRCRARGVAISWRRYVLAGTLLAPALLLGTVPLL